MSVIDIHEAAQGRWRGILAHYGLSQRELSGKHCPCPICGGTDRFRFDDKGGRGTWICSHCGAGSGMDMVMKLRGWDFREALSNVRKIIGMCEPETAKPGISDDDKRRLRMDLWASSVPVEPGNMAHNYFVSRGVDRLCYPSSLRFAESCRYSADKNFPALIAAIQDADGRGVSLHRTFLQDGQKAPVDSPKMLMPGSIPSGSAIRLGRAGDVLGIAEGLETAMAASDAFEIPVWAAVSASLLAEWEPPHGVCEVAIFGDNDANFTGQAAAYQLARRISRKNLEVTVHIPPHAGRDWADYTIAGVLK